MIQFPSFIDKSQGIYQSPVIIETKLDLKSKWVCPSSIVLWEARSFVQPFSRDLFSLHFLSSSLFMEKAMATHSSTLAWKIPWTEEPGRLQSMGSLRVGHNWATSLSLSCIGEGNGTPLQCSCLENPRDGGAWWAAVYGVGQSRTPLKRLSSSLFTIPEGSVGKETACNVGRPVFDPWVRKIPGEGNGTHSNILAWEFPWTEESGGLQSLELRESDTTYN